MDYLLHLLKLFELKLVNVIVFLLPI